MSGRHSSLYSLVKAREVPERTESGSALYALPRATAMCKNIRFITVNAYKVILRACCANQYICSVAFLLNPALLCESLLSSARLHAQ